jgi:hypothetical protein
VQLFQVNRQVWVTDITIIEYLRKLSDSMPSG